MDVESNDERVALATTDSSVAPVARRRILFLVAGIAVVGIIICHMLNKDRVRKRQSVTQYLAQPGMMMTAPNNLLVEAASADPTSAIVDLRLCHAPLVGDLEMHWKAIREEARQMQMSPIRGDMFFDKLAKDDAWQRSYLKWYGNVDVAVRDRCPVTVALLDRHPSIHLAMFSLLKAGGSIPEHTGPFRGCIRVHVGLETPNDNRCHIKIGHETYSWRDGQVVGFDDTYPHSVTNQTRVDRLILFLDVERTMNSQIGSAINRLLIRHIAPLTTRSNARQERVSIQEST